jgi:hypothetical protein
MGGDEALRTQQHHRSTPDGYLRRAAGLAATYGRISQLAQSGGGAADRAGREYGAGLVPQEACPLPTGNAGSGVRAIRGTEVVSLLAGSYLGTTEAIYGFGHRVHKGLPSDSRGSLLPPPLRRQA